MDQLEDYGAFLRAPMPGPLYRMHGAVTGGYIGSKTAQKLPHAFVRGVVISGGVEM